MLLFLAQFHVPIRQIDEVFPAFVVVHPEIDLNKRTPFGALGFADEMHPGFLRSVVGLAGVAGDAGANDVFPSRGTAAIARDDVVQIQVFAIQGLAAILAHVIVPFENVVPGEFDFLLRQAVEHDKQDDTRDAYSEGDGVDAFRMRILLGEILPLIEAEGLESAVVSPKDGLCMPFEKKGEGAAGCADVDSLPKAVQDQHMLV
jgi:hypothetical protein